MPPAPGSRFLLAFISSVPAAADTLTDLSSSRYQGGGRDPCAQSGALVGGAEARRRRCRAAAAGWLKGVPFEGVNLLRDVDEVVIASSGKGPNPAEHHRHRGGRPFQSWPRSGGVTPPRRVCHDVPLLIGGETEGEHRGRPAGCRHGGDQRSRPRFAPPSTGAAARARSIAALNDRITSLRQRYDIWGLGDRVPDGIRGWPIPEAQVLQSIDRFQFGMQLANGVELERGTPPPLIPKDAGEAGRRPRSDRRAVEGAGNVPADRFDVPASRKAELWNWLTSPCPTEAELQKAIEARTGVVYRPCCHRWRRPGHSVIAVDRRSLPIRVPTSRRKPFRVEAAAAQLRCHLLQLP